MQGNWKVAITTLATGYIDIYSNYVSDIECMYREK